MADNQSRPSTERTSSDTHIPPPTDPYVTYQTPYPRRPSDEVQNPFIEFRRLADAAFSSFFSGLPRVLGTEKFKAANIKESELEFVKAFDQQARDFESRIAEMVRARVEEAEGFRKQVEQEWEERRRENEKRMEEENQKWEMMRRGLERCPGLRPDGMNAKEEADNELDLYDGLKAYEAPAYKPKAEAGNSEPRKCPWKDEKIDKRCPWNDDDKSRNGWFAGLGFDGKKRARQIPLYVRRSRESRNAERNVDWQEYNDEEMDPFTDDDHVVPWLKLSPYSPLSLISSQAWIDASDAVCVTSDARRALSELPWDEAFEDLMSVHKTGKLPNLVRRLVYWGGPNQWITEMAFRGSLGSKWEEGFMVAALMGAVRGNQWRGFDALKAQCSELCGRHFGETSGLPIANELANQVHEDGFDDAEDEDEDEDEYSHPDEWTKLVRGALGPNIWEKVEQLEEHCRELFGERQSPEKSFGAYGMLWPSPDEVLSALSGTSSRIEQGGNSVHNGKISESPDTTQDDWSRSSVSQSAWSSTNSNNIVDGLISTFTTTDSRTLPDGSVETRTVIKKRFADGKEESSESTTVQPPRSAHTGSPKASSLPNGRIEKEEQKSGWFWN